MSQSETPRVDAVAPVDAFVTDSDHWAVDKTDYDALLKVALDLERELAAAQQALGTWRRLYADMEERYEQERSARERAETECERLQSEVYDLQTMLSDMSAKEKP